MEMLVILRNGNPEKKNVTFIKLITINWVPSHWEKEIWSASQKGMCFYFSVIVAQNGTQEKKKKISSCSLKWSWVPNSHQIYFGTKIAFLKLKFQLKLFVYIIHLINSYADLIFINIYFFLISAIILKQTYIK